ncbi:MAG: tetratricopeptide repeat protein [Sedimentisphaerales bacterium]|nr:tetratricopeptide repeat protein [Sedimentisphaerales bacterium]
MKRKTGKINWKLLLVLFLATIVMAATIYGLRRWQVGGRAEQALARGIQAFEDKEWDTAADQLGRYVSMKPDDAEMLMKYAQAQLNRIPPKPEQLVQARNAYRQVLRLDESYSIDSIRREATLAVAQIYLQTGGVSDAGEAQLVLERQLHSGPDNDLKRLLAAALEKQRKFAEAVALLKEIVAEDKTDILAYAMLGRLAESRPEFFGDPASRADKEHLVLSFLNAAIQENPSTAKALVVRSQYYVRNGRRDKAIADLQMAKTLPIDSINERLTLAEAMINTGLLEEASGQLEMVQQQDSENLVLWRMWAELAKRKGDQGAMKEVAQKILRLPGKEKDLLLSIVTELFILSADYEQSQKCIAQMRQNKMMEGHIDFLLGLQAEKQNRPREAIDYWQRALQGGMDTEEIHFRLAMAHQAIQDPQSAIGHLRRIISQEQSLRASLFLAELLMETGQFAEAVQQAQSILQVLPDDSKARLLLTQARLFMTGLETATSSAEWNKLLADIDSLEKTDSDLVTVRLLRIRTLLRRFKALGSKADLDEAGRIAQELEKDLSQDVRAGLATVEVWIAAGELDKARQRLEALVSQYPDDLTPIQYLVSVYEQLQQSDRSPQVIEESLLKMQRSSDRRQLSLLLAHVYQKLNFPDKAFAVTEQMLQDWPEDIEILRKAIGYARAAGYTDKLPILIDRIKTIEGQRGWQWRYEQARLWFDSEQFTLHYPEIVEMLKENLLANPVDQLSRTLLAASQAKNGDYHLAVAQYQDALTRDPDNVTLLISTVSALYRAGEIEKAEALLADATRRRLYDPEMRLTEMQIHALLMKEQLPSAGQLLEDMLSKMPENDQARLVLAGIRIQQKQYDQAMALLDDLAQRKPDSAEVAAARVAVYLERGDPEQAMRESNAFIQRADTPEAYMLRARVYLKLEQIEDATRDMQKVRDKQSDPIKAILIETGFYITAGRIDKARELIKPAISQYPQDQQILRQAAILLASSDNAADREQAGELVDKAIRLGGEDIALVLLKIQYLLARKEDPSTQQALEELDKLTRKYPRAEQVWAMQATTYLAQGKRIKALETVHLGLRYLPKSIDLNLLKARCEALTSSPGLAANTLERLASQYPDRLDIAINLAEMYVAAGQTAKAVQLLQSRESRAKNVQEKNTVRIALAVALQSSGDWKQARELYQQLLTEQPENVLVINNLAWILCEQEKKYSEALQMADKGLKLKPDYTDLLDTRGVIYYRIQQYPQSVRDLEQCIRQYPQAAPALTGTYFHLARTQTKLGDVNAARENLSIAMELNRTRGGLSEQEMDEANTLRVQMELR